MADSVYPKVSIIVASYNSQQTIEECLKSILALEYPVGYIEVIVMDGGSRDATISIAEKYSFKVISIRLNAPAAYNYAMKLASHDVFGFIDADAKVEPHWLKLLVPHLQELQVAGVSGSIETWNAETHGQKA